MKFKTIICDPPWCYDNFKDAKHGAAASAYNTLTPESLCALPVASVCDDNSVMFMWCTWPQLEVGIALIKAWGFRYISGVPWVKMTAAATPRVGIGFHARNASEFFLIGLRGNVSPPPVEKRLTGVIFSPIGKHSAKPDAQYDFAEAYEGPYLEMFARPDGGLFPAREGWTRIGNEIDGKDIHEALIGLAQHNTT